MIKVPEVLPEAPVIEEPELIIDEPEIDGGWTPDFLNEEIEADIEADIETDSNPTPCKTSNPPFL